MQYVSEIYGVIFLHWLKHKVIYAYTSTFLAHRVDTAATEKPDDISYPMSGAPSPRALAGPAWYARYIRE